MEYRLQQHEAVTCRRCAMSARRQGRFHHASRDSDDDGPTTVAVVDQAECTARSCRSCAAVTLADCIALGCCPCAVVSLLGLAFVKAPLVVGRRCVRRLRRRQGRLRHKKQVRDVVDAKCAGVAKGNAVESASCGGEVAPAAQRVSSSGVDAEKMWLEMYQVGQWGFGRLSFSVNPAKPA